MTNGQPATSSNETAAGPVGTPLTASVASSSQRIELIIEAAERAAAGIIADAEAQARSYLEQSRIHADRIATERSAGLEELADSLMARAESVKRQSAELIEALEAARAQIAARPPDDVSIPPLADTPPAAEAAGPGDAEPGTADDRFAQGMPQPAAREPAPPAPAPNPATSRPSSPPSAGARLLATQMAVAGSSREEIASRLQNEFGIADPDGMLDGIIGPRG